MTHYRAFGDTGTTGLSARLHPRFHGRTFAEVVSRLRRRQARVSWTGRCTAQALDAAIAPMDVAPSGQTGTPPSPDAGEEAAFARLAAGDPAALDTLLRHYWSPLLNYVKGLISDHDGAQDIAQEAFLYLWEGRQRWTPTGSARALLYRVARSRALNHVRHHRVRERAEPLVEAFQPGRRWTPTPLQILEQAELRGAIDEAIDALPPRRREVFVLGYVHGCRHAEVAEIMEISVQTARNQMSAALADLRRMLEPFLE